MWCLETQKQTTGVGGMDEDISKSCSKSSSEYFPNGSEYKANHSVESSKYLLVVTTQL